MEALVTGIYGSFYQVELPGKKPVRYLAKIRGKLRLPGGGDKMARRGEHPLTIGDMVEIQLVDSPKNEIQGYIMSLYPRRNRFQRTSHSRTQLLGSNLDGVIAIFSLKFPYFNEGLLSRLVVEARLQGIPLVIILNKIDYLAEANGDQFQGVFDLLDHYKGLGFKVYRESFKKGISPSLKKEFKSGRYLFFGESGVGKSTLINLLAGKELQRTDQEGERIRGRHVTTNPVLVSKGKLEIIDVPGVREFGLLHYTVQEIQNGFDEFRGRSCQFANCLHYAEPSCGVKDAVKNEEIPYRRYQSYLSILESIDEKYKPRRGDYRNQLK